MFPLMKPREEYKTQNTTRLNDTVGQENKIEENNDTNSDPHSHTKIDLPIIEETLTKYSTTTKDHNLTVGRCMRYFAEKLGKNTDYWYAVGVLHDVDWDLVEKDASRHCGESLETILKEMNAPE